MNDNGFIKRIFPNLITISGYGILIEVSFLINLTSLHDTLAGIFSALTLVIGIADHIATIILKIFTDNGVYLSKSSIYSVFINVTIGLMSLIIEIYTFTNSVIKGQFTPDGIDDLRVVLFNLRHPMSFLARRYREINAPLAIATKEMYIMFYGVIFNLFRPKPIMNRYVIFLHFLLIFFVSITFFVLYISLYIIFAILLFFEIALAVAVHALKIYGANVIGYHVTKYLVKRNPYNFVVIKNISKFFIIFIFYMSVLAVIADQLSMFFTTK